MGYNATVVVYNDALDAIEKDPEFGKKLAAAITHVGCFGDQSDSLSRSPSAGNHCNAAYVVETHHADHLVAVAVGSNMGQEIGFMGHWGLDMTKKEDRIKALKALASNEGYGLRKNPTKGKA